MAVITIPKKLFEKEIGRLDEKMQEKIAMLGTPIESLTNDELQLEIFPNRPDMLSYHGFKRAFLAFLEKKTGLKKYKINKPNKDYKVIVDSSVNGIRPYTSCAIVRNLRLNSEKIKELMEIQEKLHTTLGRKRRRMAIGVYPLEKINLPIKFLALEPDKIKFTPLESEKAMSGLEILQKHHTGKEYAHLLSGKAKFPVFMDSENKILSMPPIINSQNVGRITEKTKSIFIECSGFEQKLMDKCLTILTSALSDMGGKVFEMEVHYGRERKLTPNFRTEKMQLNIDHINKLLGLELNEKETKKLLEKMGYNYNEGKAEIPAWRTDILHEVDLIEDIAIAYGYENFTPEIPDISTIGEENPQETIKRKISDILSGLGMQEVSNYHLTTKTDQIKKMELKEKGYIEVENSKTDYSILRQDLSHCLLKVFSENVKNEFPQKIFEMGKIFPEKRDFSETESLAAAISPGDYTEIKQALEYLSSMSGVEIKTEESKESPHYFIKGRAAEIQIKGKKVGFIGEIHPKILKKWKIRMPVALFEFNLERLMEEVI